MECPGHPADRYRDRGKHPDISRAVLHDPMFCRCGPHMWKKNFPCTCFSASTAMIGGPKCHLKVETTSICCSFKCVATTLEHMECQGLVANVGSWAHGPDLTRAKHQRLWIPFTLTLQSERPPRPFKWIYCCCCSLYTCRDPRCRACVPQPQSQLHTVRTAP